MNIWLLIIGIVTITYLARYSKIDSANYSMLIAPPVKDNAPKSKRILVLEDTPSYFRQNALATPYLNWSLSEEIFRNPGYYENLTAVYHSLKADPPQVIIDRENLMKPFFERMPELKKRYRRMGDVYNRIDK